MVLEAIISYAFEKKTHSQFFSFLPSPYLILCVFMCVSVFLENPIILLLPSKIVK